MTHRSVTTEDGQTFSFDYPQQVSAGAAIRHQFRSALDRMRADYRESRERRSSTFTIYSHVITDIDLDRHVIAATVLAEVSHRWPATATSAAQTVSREDDHRAPLLRPPALPRIYPALHNAGHPYLAALVISSPATAAGIIALAVVIATGR